MSDRRMSCGTGTRRPPIRGRQTGYFLGKSWQMDFLETFFVGCCAMVLVGISATRGLGIVSLHLLGKGTLPSYVLSCRWLKFQNAYNAVPVLIAPVVFFFLGKPWPVGGGERRPVGRRLDGPGGRPPAPAQRGALSFPWSIERFNIIRIFLGGKSGPVECVACN